MVKYAIKIRDEIISVEADDIEEINDKNDKTNLYLYKDDELIATFRTWEYWIKLDED